MAGYSGTPLWKKLGLKDGARASVLNPPAHYHSELLHDAPAVRWGPLEATRSIIHVFSTQRRDLENTLRTALPLLERDGMIWVSWPKKNSKVPSAASGDTIREVALPMGLVDVKVCAVDTLWSGLKLVIRKDLR